MTANDAGAVRRTRWAAAAGVLLSLAGLARAETPLGRSAGLISPARTGSAMPITLDRVLHSVERAFPLLRAAEQERALADAEHLSAKGGFDFSVRSRAIGAPTGYYQNGRFDFVVEKPTEHWGTSFFAGYRLGLGNFADYDGKLETGNMGEARIGLNVPLWRGGPIDRRRAELWRAELGRRTAELAILQRRLGIVRAAADRYWAWVAAARKLDVARALLEIARARDEGLAEGVRRGQFPAIERDENQRAILQRRAQLVAAEQAFERAGVELALYYRDEDGRPQRPALAEVPPGLPAIVNGFGGPLQAAVHRGLRWRPEAARLLIERQRTQIELDFAQNLRKPGIDLQAAFSQDFGDGKRALTRPELEVAVVVDIPIQTRVADGRMAAARARMARLDEEERFAKERIEADVRAVLVALRAAEARAQMLAEELRVARLLEDAEREKFRLGMSNLFLVNLREQSTADTAVREIDARADYHRAVAHYRVAIGCTRTICD